MTNKSGTLYTGVTNNLERRVYGHKNHLVNGFTKRYKINKLVYFEDTNDINEAILREKQIKGWLRKKIIALIESINPDYIVILSAAKNLAFWVLEILRCAQDDKESHFHQNDRIGCQSTN
jgi:putative endonuclease